MNNDELILFFKNKNVLITGGTGLIGRFIVDKLCSYEAKVTVVSLDDLTLNDRAKYIKGDLTNFEFCKEITKNVVSVFLMFSPLIERFGYFRQQIRILRKRLVQ